MEYIKAAIYAARSWFDFMIILPAMYCVIKALDTLSSGREDVEEATIN